MLLLPAWLLRLCETVMATTHMFSAILSAEFSLLVDHSPDQLEQFLPSLGKITTPSHGATLSTIKPFFSLLLGMESCNNFKRFLQLNMKDLQGSAIQAEQLVMKRSIDDRSDCSTTNFEKSSIQQKYNLVVFELLKIVHQANIPIHMNLSDLFFSTIFMNDVGCLVSIAVKDLPEILNIAKVSEGLLRVTNGCYFISRLVKNLPEVFSEVLMNLILNGELLDEFSLAGKIRSQSIQEAVKLLPTQASFALYLMFLNQKLPSLMILLALNGYLRNDESHKNRRNSLFLSLMKSIVIYGNNCIRSWFTHYMKLMQQKYRRHRESAVTTMRRFLMHQLNNFINKSHGVAHDESHSEVELKMSPVTIVELENNSNMDSITMELVDQMEIEISEPNHDYNNQKKSNDGESRSKSDKMAVYTADMKESNTLQDQKLSFVSECLPLLSKQFTDSHIEDLSELLHVFCGLKLQSHMFLTCEESSVILQLITSTFPPFSSAGIMYVKVALSVLLACPFLISFDDGGEKAVLQWLKWLLDTLPEFERVCTGESCYGEMLLLLAMHLHDKKDNQIQELIQSVLGICSVGTLKSGQFSTLRSVFLKVFDESTICSHAVRVKPTRNLNNKMPGYLPVHCVHQLMQSKAFRKHGVSIKDWIFNQICCCDEPLHTVMPLMIEEYVLSILNCTMPSSSRPKNIGTYACCQNPISVSQVLTIFSDQSHCSSCSQVLMLYYVLFYQDCVLSWFNKQQSITYSCTRDEVVMNLSGHSVFTYNSDVIQQLPIKRLLKYTSNNQTSFSSLYPSLLRLIVAHFPNFCSPEDWIIQEDLLQVPIFKPVVNLPAMKLVPKFVSKVLQKSIIQKSLTIVVLSDMLFLSLFDLLPFCSSIASFIPYFLEKHYTSKEIQLLVSSLWIKLNLDIPRRLCVETLNFLVLKSDTDHHCYAYQTYVKDPMIILNCNDQAFRCPSMFEIMLQILSSFLAASCVCLLDHTHNQNITGLKETRDNDLTPNEREELQVALLAAQESSIIQVLLEVCLPFHQDKTEDLSIGNHLASLNEIHGLVGSYLHQVFISKPSLAKLVHFQGYSVQLLPIIALGVPSLHIAMDFVLELFSQPMMINKVFAVQLAFNVMAKYPLKDLMVVSLSILRELKDLICEMSMKKRNAFFKCILTAIVKLCHCFPSLSIEAIKLLLDICQCQSIRGPDGCFCISPFHNVKHSSQQEIKEQLIHSKSMSLAEGVYCVFLQIVEIVVVPMSGKS